MRRTNRPGSRNNSTRSSTRRRRVLSATALLAVGAALLAGCRGAGDSAEATPGITDSSVTLGFTEPYTGSLAGNGIPLRDGIRAYVDSVNANGGVNGRKIELRDYDNGYDPARAVDAARRLVESDGVFAIFGGLGTPVNVAMRDYLAGKKVPNLFIGTGDESALGAGQWATSALASYPGEAAVYTSRLLKRNPTAKIAVIYQNDDLGKAHLDTIEQTVKGTGASVVARQSYEVTDVSVAPQLDQLAASGADALIVVATGKTASQIFATVGGMSWKPKQIVANNSASTIPGLKAAGFQNAQGILSTVYLKDPSDPQWSKDPGAQKYLTVMHTYAGGADAQNYFTAAGYTYAQMTVAALQNMKQPTRESAMEAAKDLPPTALDMLVPGIKAHTTPGNPHAVSALQPAVFKGTSWTLDGEPVDVRS